MTCDSWPLTGVIVHLPLYPSTIRELSRRLLIAGAICTGLSSAAFAQTPPPPQPGASGNPICQRLEVQLASIDRGGGDPARAEQLRKFEEASAKQQGELDRVSAQAKKLGCDSSGFFSLFSGQSAQCGPVNNQIQQMRGNLDQINTSLERLRVGGGNLDRDNQRRSVMTALAQNNCGPQYTAAARQGGGGFFDNLFGGGNQVAAPGGEFAPPSGTFRTVCVRACDGYYFPISFATSQSRLSDDERSCKALCPATEANLYAYRNPGEDINQAVSTGGQTYASSPNAFKFRQEFVPACQCKGAGQTWSDALKNIDDKASAAQGDIIVTEEQAKRMSQPQNAKQPAAAQKKGATPVAAAPAAAPATTATAPAPAETGTTPENRPIRSVGPTFVPAKQ